MRAPYKKICYVFTLCLMLPITTKADVITFDFTGRLVVVDPFNSVMNNNGLPYTPISASLEYDTVSGIGSSNLSITMADDFFQLPVTFHYVTMTHQAGTNLITGQALVDFGPNLNMPLHVEWDATGLFNAINFGLQAGDVLSGSDLYHDANGNGVQDIGEYLTDIDSAIPYSDSLQPALYQQGPAPMAATLGSLGLDDTTPFAGIRGFIDIGSGNSMHVVSVQTVPIPAAVWLFGSGLIGLIGAARRRTDA